MTASGIVEVDQQRVQSEWLYHAEQRERRLFIREGQEFAVTTSFRREAPLTPQHQTRPNALFLSVLAQFNSETATGLLGWFRLNLRGILRFDDQSHVRVAMQRLDEDEYFRQRACTMLRLADTGILDLSTETLSLDHPDVPEELRQLLIRPGNQEQL